MRLAAPAKLLTAAPATVAPALALMAALVTVGCQRPEPGSHSSGNRTVIQNKGSDTLVNVAQTWAEKYKEKNPSVAVAVSGGGSGTGISALINGTVDLANSSRELKDKEVEMARARGFEPIEHVVGFDAVTIFLHHDNPIDEISLEQLKGIYGEGGEITRWSQLGVEVPGCPSDEIIRVSRQNNSGTYVYFKEVVLGPTTDFKLGSRDLHGSKDVADLVIHTPCAIGYSGLAYTTPEIKMPCVKSTADGPCVAPSVETAVDRTYPIARPLFMFSHGQPTGAAKEYLEWILSDEGQCIIQEKGYAAARLVSCP